MDVLYGGTMCPVKRKESPRPRRTEGSERSTANNAKLAKLLAPLSFPHESRGEGPVPPPGRWAAQVHRLYVTQPG